MDFKKVLFKTKEFDVEKALPDAIVFCNKDFIALSALAR